jgi:hypothetical protein
MFIRNFQGTYERSSTVETLKTIKQKRRFMNRALCVGYAAGSAFQKKVPRDVIATQ